MTIRNGLDLFTDKPGELKEAVLVSSVAPIDMVVGATESGE